MADTKISALTAASAALTTDELPTNEGGTTKKVTLAQVDTLLSATTKTLTNKTLTAPVIGTIVNTGTLTLPTATDTLVGRATTDTLTNKTITGAANTLTVRLANDVTGTLPVVNGGNGQTTYTDGQLLIGNTSGNTLSKATLTAGTGMVNVVNGNGSITLNVLSSIPYQMAQGRAWAYAF